MRTVQSSHQLGSILGIWFVCWGLRRNYDLDESLTDIQKVLRWVFVGCFYAMSHLLVGRIEPLRIICVFLMLGFVCWPNLTWRITKPFIKPAPNNIA